MKPIINMSRDELIEWGERLAKKANQRLTSLRSKGIRSHAVESLNKRGEKEANTISFLSNFVSGEELTKMNKDKIYTLNRKGEIVFSRAFKSMGITKDAKTGKIKTDISALRHAVAELESFLSSKTSTIKGARETNKANMAGLNEYMKNTYGVEMTQEEFDLITSNGMLSDNTYNYDEVLSLVNDYRRLSLEELDKFGKAILRNKDFNARDERLKLAIDKMRSLGKSTDEISQILSGDLVDIFTKYSD